MGTLGAVAALNKREAEEATRRAVLAAALERRLAAPLELGAVGLEQLLDDYSALKRARERAERAEIATLGTAAQQRALELAATRSWCQRDVGAPSGPSSDSAYYTP